MIRPPQNTSINSLCNLCCLHTLSLAYFFILYSISLSHSSCHTSQVPSLSVLCNCHDPKFSKIVSRKVIYISLDEQQVYPLIPLNAFSIPVLLFFIIFLMMPPSSNYLFSLFSLLLAFHSHLILAAASSVPFGYLNHRV